MNVVIDINDVILKTSRLTLRPFKEEDLDDLNEYASVEGVGECAGWHHHKNKEDSANILKLFIERRNTFALIYNGKVIGSLGMHDYNEKDYPELDNYLGKEIGYVLSKNYWGKGLMPEAVKAVINYLFEKVKLDFIMVRHFEWNNQSKRVIEKCGFKYYNKRKELTQMATSESSIVYILWKDNYNKK